MLSTRIFRAYWKALDRYQVPTVVITGAAGLFLWRFLIAGSVLILGFDVVAGVVAVVRGGVVLLAARRKARSDRLAAKQSNRLADQRETERRRLAELNAPLEAERARLTREGKLKTLTEECRVICDSIRQMESVDLDTREAMINQKMEELSTRLSRM
jgi:uncharacterized membrane protein